MSKHFNTDMTSSEAFMAFSKATESMTRSEREEFPEKEYRPVVKVIREREHELGRQGWMMSE